MERFTRFIVKRRWLVIGVWVVSIAVGMGWSANTVNDRLSSSFSATGFESIDAAFRQIDSLGNGGQPPYVLVISAKDGGDVTEASGAEDVIERVSGALKGSRASSFFNTGDDAYVSEDRKVMIANIYPPGELTFTSAIPQMQTITQALKESPDGLEVRLTGYNALFFAEPEAADASILADVIIGSVGALVILLFVFGTLPAVLMPLIIAITSILTTFTFVAGVTYVTDVSIVVQFLIGLVGLGIAIDYSLLVIFRYREELAAGRDESSALTETIRHSGHAVIVSGTTVAISLMAMVVMPVDFIRSIGYGGLLIPLVSVLAALTLLPALLSLLGKRINSIPLLPRRWTTVNEGSGFWPKWSALVTRRPVPIALIGVMFVALLAIPGLNMHPSDVESKDVPGSGPLFEARDDLKKAGFTDGVLKPLMFVIEGDDAAAAAPEIAKRLREVDGIVAATNPQGGWSNDEMTVVEAFTEADGSSRAGHRLVRDLKRESVPEIEDDLGGDVKVTVAGGPAEGLDFIDAIYGNMPLLFTVVGLLTFVLLARATRSLLLPLKAVIVNVVSLVAAFGAIVLIFQWGYGAEAIWGVNSTNSISSWVPLMIFAFLFGISMDYEVFMLSRIREEYDRVGDTSLAIGRGLQRTGKLITSGSLILMFSFFVLSTGPGIDLKQFAVGLAAGIIVDATVIRILLVPSVMMLMGSYNWWFPDWAAKLLFVKPTNENGLDHDWAPDDDSGSRSDNSVSGAEMATQPPAGISS